MATTSGGRPKLKSVAVVATLMMRWNYARALSKDDRATHGDLRDAVTTLEETVRTARRVLGGAHPTTVGVERDLRDVRDALYARGLS